MAHGTMPEWAFGLQPPDSAQSPGAGFPEAEEGDSGHGDWEADLTGLLLEGKA